MTFTGTFSRQNSLTDSCISFNVIFNLTYIEYYLAFHARVITGTTAQLHHAMDQKWALWSFCYCSSYHPEDLFLLPVPFNLNYSCHEAGCFRIEDLNLHG